MVNFERDPEAIKAALDKGLITKSDYSAWLGAEGYKIELKKSCDAFCITENECKAETEKANGLYWERDDQTKGVFRFVLKGNFEPIDLQERRMIKAKESQPLQQQRPPQRIKVEDPFKKINSLLDGITKDQKHSSAMLGSKPIVKSNEQKPITQQSQKRPPVNSVSLGKALSLAATLLNEEAKRKGKK